MRSTPAIIAARSWPKQSSAPAMIRLSKTRLPTIFGSMRSQKSSRSGERLFAALRDDVLDRRVADALDGGQRIEDAVLADLEVAERGHAPKAARRRCRGACASWRKSASLSVFDMSSVIDAARNSTGIMRLQIGRLVGDDRIGRGVASC